VPDVFVPALLTLAARLGRERFMCSAMTKGLDKDEGAFDDGSRTILQ
jgi:hypothetical protein